jgi:hypothetical protein
MPILAFTKTLTGPVPLNHFNDTPVIHLQVDQKQSLYLVFGRVVVSNDDDSAQNASARLTTHTGDTQLDRVDLRLDAGSEGKANSISLQGILDLRDPKQFSDVVEMHCATFKGVATEASLFAFSVDGLTRE